MEGKDNESKTENYADKRSGRTLAKYRRDMAWRRQKVRELLSRGYAQNDISNILHISQPTISRDIHYIQREIGKSKEKNVERMYEAHWSRLMALDEAIKKLWTIADSANTDDKDRIKAIALVIQYHKDKFDMIRSEPDLTQQKKYINMMELQAASF